MSFLWTAFTLSAAFMLVLPGQAKPSEPAAIVGDWVVAKKSTTKDTRLVSFSLKNGQLGGSYTTRSGRKEPITGAGFANKSLSFRVPSVRLLFRNLKFVGSTLEGELIDGNPGEMRGKPMAVRMVRSKSRA
jgi:hypothetical protein